MSIQIVGINGEQMARDFLNGKGFHLFQADWIAQDSKGEYYLFEIKHQEPFEPPPFKGHGLPLWQVIARLNFQKARNVIAMILVRDKIDNKWYYQRLDILEAGEHIDTHGKYPRRIYPIINFHCEASA